jgi:hypothetical protein
VNPETPLRQWIERHLQGRSWNWLGRSLSEPVSGTTVRNWADGRYELPAFRADQIAAVFGADPDEVRTAAGLEPQEKHDGNTAAITQPGARPLGIRQAPHGADGPVTDPDLLRLVAELQERVERLEHRSQ